MDFAKLLVKENKLMSVEIFQRILYSTFSPRQNGQTVSDESTRVTD